LANVPSYNTNNISLGPGILYIGVAGTTPTTDVGAISEDGLTFTLEREFLDVYQGQPKTLIVSFPISETVTCEVQTIEWNLMNLPLALGAGVTTSTASKDTFSFGEDPGNDQLAVHIEHVIPSGQTMSIYIWKAQPTGSWELNMAQDTLHTFPHSFKALSSPTAWDGSALPVGQRLFRITRFKI